MDKLLSVWTFISRHKYLITVLVFSVVIGFLDENSIIRRIQYRWEINMLNKEIGKYRKEYEESTKRLNELVTDPEMIEQIAREKYRMKKPNEDIYIFENE
ncbi:MAG: septum formation initiator family protein [Tannerellaceae bacterium]|jgi:cell division protein FtsB|nr:septum formation initiator family protein [Tannerellaceae bacterium]